MKVFSIGVMARGDWGGRVSDEGGGSLCYKGLRRWGLQAFLVGYIVDVFRSDRIFSL